MVLGKILKKRRQDKKSRIYKENVSGGITHLIFPPDTDEVYSISEWYAGESESNENEECSPYCRELQISLTPCDWCKFQEQDFYPDLMKYLDNLKIQRQSKLPDKERGSQEGKEFL